MTYGVIDVGSNTIRLCIYNIEGDRIISLFNNKNTAGLIDYVNDGELSGKGIKKACDVLNSQRYMAAQAQVKELYVFATAFLRNISNTGEAVRRIKRKQALMWTYSADTMRRYSTLRALLTPNTLKTESWWI